MYIRYLKRVDTFQNNHVHCFLTGGNVKFMLLMNPDPSTTAYSTYAPSPPTRPRNNRQSSLIAANPTSPQTEEAVRTFMTEVIYQESFPILCLDPDVLQVYEAWMKCLMNPFYAVNQPVTSPIFRQRVQTAARKYL
jgi:hypothetical protein